jgi:hypothetical protein
LTFEVLYCIAMAKLRPQETELANRSGGGRRMQGGMARAGQPIC